MTLRAALIGCGKIGTEFADDPRAPGIYSHAGAYSACSDTRLAAVCDADTERAKRCAMRWNLDRYYSDVSEMLNQEQPDLVSVCTPDSTHYEILDHVLAHSSVKGVLAEKPLATTLAQARRIVQKAHSRGIKLLVNYSRRFDPAHRRIKLDLEQGKIGMIQSVIGRYTKGTMHNGTHWFDLARYLFGNVEQVWGAAGRSTGENSPDPNFDAVLKFRTGLLAHLSGCDASAYSIFEMDILGTSGRLQITESGHHISFSHVIDSPYYSGYKCLKPEPAIENPLKDLLLLAIEELVLCVKQGIQASCSGEDGVAALSIALAVQQSAAQARWVEILDE